MSNWKKVKCMLTKKENCLCTPLIHITCDYVNVKKLWTRYRIVDGNVPNHVWTQ